MLQSVAMSSTHLWNNVVTSVSGGGGGSYSYTDSVYLSTVDTNSYGKCYGKVRRDLVGGIYNNTATNNGSRSLYCNKIPNTKDALSTTRGCSQKKRIGRSATPTYYFILPLFLYP